MERASFARQFSPHLPEDQNQIASSLLAMTEQSRKAFQPSLRKKNAKREREWASFAKKLRSLLLQYKSGNKKFTPL